MHRTSQVEESDLLLRIWLLDFIVSVRLHEPFSEAHGLIIFVVRALQMAIQVILAVTSPGEVDVSGYTIRHLYISTGRGRGLPSDGVGEA